MNTVERDQLAQFLEQLTRVQAGPKDAEAQGMINRAMGVQPDAAYLLVQRALLQDGALKVSQDRIAELQDEVNRLRQSAPQAPAPSGGGFLDANAWGRNPVRPAAATTSNFASTPPAAQAPAAYPPNVQNMSTASLAPAAAAPGFQAPSFLTSMATTAAGVAAGAFLFQGIGHLMGGGHGNAAASAFGLGGPQKPDAGETGQSSELANNHFDAPKAGGDTLADGGSPTAGGGFDSAGLDFDRSGASAPSDTGDLAGVSNVSEVQDMSDGADFSDDWA